MGSISQHVYTHNLLQDIFSSAHDLKRPRDTREILEKFSWEIMVMLGLILLLGTNLDMNVALAMPLPILIYEFLKLPEITSCNSPNQKKAFLTVVSKTVGRG